MKFLEGIASSLVVLFAASPTSAAKITLLCTGTLNVPPHGPSKFQSETAILDLDNQTIKLPNWVKMQITSTSETDVFFGTENSSISVTGNLDRISGSLNFTSMKPEEKRKFENGSTAQFAAWMSAKCAPAQKMF